MIRQNTITWTEERSRFHTFLLCCGIIGAALFSIVNFTFGALSPDYDVARQSVGDLEMASFGWVQSANFILTGLFMTAFAWGLRMELVSGPGAVSLPALQAALGIIMSLLGIFVHTPVHTILGIVFFIVIVFNFLIFARRFSMDTRWKGWASYTIASAAAMIVLFVFYTLSRQHHGAFAGLFERGILLTRVIWTLFFTVRLIAGARVGPVNASQS
jgi:hypothetical membrane protein